MDKKGLEIHKAKGQLRISKANGKIVMEGQLHHNLYEINCIIAPPNSIPSNIAFAAQHSNLDLWH